MHVEPDDVRRYLDGSLPDHEAAGIDSHLADCSKCEETLHSIAPDLQTLAELLRQSPATDELLNEPACSAMLSSIESLSGENVQPPNPADGGTLCEGKFLREYQILEKLGAGGMGTVYRARHTRLHKDVALKILPADRLADPQAVARFEREMLMVGQLEHPHLVRATDAGLHEGIHFLVMDLVDGVDLDRLVRKRGPLPIPDACEVIQQAALGLQHAYSKGIVHRDIKPSNLMLGNTSEGRYVVKVLDLGLARLSEGTMDAPGELTSNGQVMGTIDYMAPEQGRDTRAVDIRADLYSLGATLYKLLTGQSPLAGSGAKSLMDKLVALSTAPPKPIRELRPAVPEELASIVHRLLEKSPDERPATPRDVAECLQPFTRGSDLTDLATTTPNREASQLADVAQLARADHRRGRHSPRFRWIPLLAAVGGLALLGAVVVTFLTREGTLEIVVDTPSDISQIEVDGDSVEWTSSDKPGTYRLQLKPGRVMAVVLTTADGREIQAEIPGSGLRIAAGKQHLVSAHWRDHAKPESSLMEANKTASQSFGKHQQEVIAWVRSMGGSVGGGNAEIGYVGVPAGQELPAGRFDLNTVDLYQTVVSDEDLTRFGDLPFLTTFIVNGCQIGDAGFRAMGELPALYKMYLNGTRLTDDGLQALTRYPKLEILHIGSTSVTDKGLTLLSAWPKLVELSVSGCPITEDAIPHLALSKNLRTLFVGQTSISTSGIQQLREALPECRIVDDRGSHSPLAEERGDRNDRIVAEWAHGIGGTVGLASATGFKTYYPGDKLPDGDVRLVTMGLDQATFEQSELARLNKLAHLNTLILNGLPLSDAAVDRLGELPALRSLYLGGARLSDAGLDRLTSRYPELCNLHIGETLVTEAGVRHLSRLTNLNDLNTHLLPLGDTSVEFLLPHRGLQELAIAGTQLTADGVARLRDGLPNCRIHSAHGDFEPRPIEGKASLRFNGFDQSVGLPGLSFDGTPPVTIELRARLQRPYDPYGMVICNSLAEQPGPFTGINWNPKEGWAFRVQTDAMRTVFSLQPEPIERYVAGVWDGEELRLFLDGKLVARRQYLPGKIADAPIGDFVLGGAQTASGQYRYFYFKGMLDEIRLSKIARYSVDYEPIARLETDEHTLALYHCDEGTGDKLIDSSGNGHDGSLRGATWATGQ